METSEVLRSIVSTLSGLPAEQLHGGVILDEIKLRGSIKRARLDAELRKRLKTSYPGVYTAKTFGELEAGVLGQPAPVASSVPAAPAPAPEIKPGTDFPSSPGCGIDLERVESLPVVLDYWEDPFYLEHFTPVEIAYCSLQTSPRMHFAARWCAKEALIKCDNTFLGAKMNQIELARGTDGQVSLVRLKNGGFEPLPHAVSISHSDTHAVAIVVNFPASANKAGVLAEIAGKLEAALAAAR